jgi:hypothetical protein
LEVELRHCLVDERLRAGTAESALFLPGFCALRRSGFNALRDAGFNGTRRGHIGRRRPSLECVFVIRSRSLCASQRQHGGLAGKTLGANRLGRFRLSPPQAFSSHLLVLPVSLKTLGTKAHVGDAGVDRLDRIVALESGRRRGVRNCR